MERKFFGALTYDPNPDQRLMEFRNVLIFRVPSKVVRGFRFFNVIFSNP